MRLNKNICEFVETTLKYKLLFFFLCLFICTLPKGANLSMLFLVLHLEGHQWSPPRRSLCRLSWGAHASPQQQPGCATHHNNIFSRLQTFILNPQLKISSSRAAIPQLTTKPQLHSKYLPFSSVICQSCAGFLMSRLPQNCFR